LFLGAYGQENLSLKAVTAFFELISQAIRLFLSPTERSLPETAKLAEVAIG